MVERFFQIFSATKYYVNDIMKNKLFDVVKQYSNQIHLFKFNLIFPSKFYYPLNLSN
jgi:hypothetical protein